MATLTDITNAVQELNPDQIRERLAQIENEERLLRTLLRAAMRRVPKPAATHREDAR